MFTMWYTICNLEKGPDCFQIVIEGLYVGYWKIFTIFTIFNIFATVLLVMVACSSPVDGNGNESETLLKTPPSKWISLNATENTFGTSGINDITYSNGKFVAVGNKGLMAYTP